MGFSSVSRPMCWQWCYCMLYGEKNHTECWISIKCWGSSLL